MKLSGLSCLRLSREPCPAPPTPPNVYADANLGIAVARRRRDQQGLRGVHSLAAPRGRTLARQLVEINDAVSIEAVANQSRADQENQNPSASLNLHRHDFLLRNCAVSLIF